MHVHLCLIIHNLFFSSTASPPPSHIFSLSLYSCSVCLHLYYVVIDKSAYNFILV